MKILIADDSELIRERIEGLIGNADGRHIVEQAADGVETLEKSTSLNPDVIILDIQMPRKNGLQVLEEISKMKSRPVVLVFTNNMFPQYRKKCLSLGARGFFNKSTDYEEMVKELNMLLRTRSQEASGASNGS